MRMTSVFLLAAVLLLGCSGDDYWGPGGEAGIYREAYRPENYREDETWKKLNARLLHYGKVARPNKPDSYWKLYFIRSKVPLSAGDGVVYVPDLWIQRAPPYLMDFMFAHEIAHDVLEHRFFASDALREPPQLAEIEADAKAVEILNKADGPQETKTKITEILRRIGTAFPPARVENLKAAIERLK